MAKIDDRVYIRFAIDPKTDGVGDIRKSLSELKKKFKDERIYLKFDIKPNATVNKDLNTIKNNLKEIKELTNDITSKPLNITAVKEAKKGKATKNKQPTKVSHNIDVPTTMSDIVTTNIKDAEKTAKQIEKIDEAYRKLSNSVYQYRKLNHSKIQKAELINDFQSLSEKIEARDFEDNTRAKEAFENLKFKTKLSNQELQINQANIDAYNKFPSKYAAASKTILSYRENWANVAKMIDETMHEILLTKKNYARGEITENPKNLKKDPKKQYHGLEKLYAELKNSYLEAEAIFQILKAGNSAHSKVTSKNLIPALTENDYLDFLSTFNTEMKKVGSHPYEPLRKYATSMAFPISYEPTSKHIDDVFSLIGSNAKNLELQTSNIVKNITGVNNLDNAYKELSNTVKAYIALNETQLKKLNLFDEFDNFKNKLDNKEFLNIDEAHSQFDKLKANEKIENKHYTEQQKANREQQHELDILNKIPEKYAEVQKAIKAYRQEWGLAAKGISKAQKDIISDSNNYKDGYITGNVNDLSANAKARHDNLITLFEQKKSEYMQAESIVSMMRAADTAYKKTTSKTTPVLNPSNYSEFKWNLNEESIKLDKLGKTYATQVKKAFSGNVDKEIFNINETASSLISSVFSDLKSADFNSVIKSVNTNKLNLFNDADVAKNINIVHEELDQLSNSVSKFISLNKNSLNQYGIFDKFEDFQNQLSSYNFKSIDEADEKFKQLKSDAKNANEDAIVEQSQINAINKIPAKFANTTKAIQKYRTEYGLYSKYTHEAMQDILDSPTNYKNNNKTHNLKDLTYEALSQYNNLQSILQEQKELYLKSESVYSALKASHNAYVDTVGKNGHILNTEQYQQYLGHLDVRNQMLKSNPNDYVSTNSPKIIQQLGEDAKDVLRIFDTVSINQKNLSNEFMPVDKIQKAKKAYEDLIRSVEHYLQINQSNLKETGMFDKFDSFFGKLKNKEIKNLFDAKQQFKDLTVESIVRKQDYEAEQRHLNILNKIPTTYEKAISIMQKYRQEYEMLLKTYEMDQKRILGNANNYKQGAITDNTSDLTKDAQLQYTQAEKAYQIQQQAYLKQENLLQILSGLNKSRELALNGKDNFSSIDELKVFQKTLQDTFGIVQGNNVFQSLAQDGEYLNKVLSQLNTGKNALDITAKEFKRTRGDEIKYGSLSASMQDYITTYEKALKTAKMYDSAVNLFENVNIKNFPDFKTAAADIETFKMQARLAGVETDDFKTKLDKTLGSRVRSAFAGSAVFMAQDAFRQMYNNVKEVDAAMTELKKVTDETADTYDRFLSNASSRAQEIGASLVETIQATAD